MALTLDSRMRLHWRFRPFTLAQIRQVPGDGEGTLHRLLDGRSETPAAANDNRRKNQQRRAAQEGRAD